MLNFLLNILAIDSTSGKEEALADYLVANYKPDGAQVLVQELPNGKKNILYHWGIPKVIFCTHLDTVPPYMPPKQNNEKIFGRGSCDAKGQIAAIYQTCNNLYKKKYTDFGMLLLAGEEIGTYGAKEANDWVKGCEYVIICEPTENKLIKAAKGTMLFDVKCKGRAAHSGYPEHGENAVAVMQRFLAKLSELTFPEDEILGKTTYNIGQLHSNNAFNVVADLVAGKIFFRTTFKSRGVIKQQLESLCDERIAVEFEREDPPLEFFTLDGFATDVVAFGSDAPKLGKLGKRMLYGPGSILNAHTDHEEITIADLERAVIDLEKIYCKINSYEQ